MVFGNKKCENNHLVSINDMYINRVYVTTFLGVHIDCHLNWSEHITLIKNKISKNVFVMYRVKHLLTSSALYSLYCTLIVIFPYLNYCCEIWGNTYKSRVRPLHIIQKELFVCLKADYRSHTRPMFYHLKTLAVQDMVDFNSMVFMYKIYIYYQLILCCTSRKLMLVTITTTYEKL